MNFAEALAKWAEFDENVDAAFDYIETLEPLDQALMLGMIFKLPYDNNKQPSAGFKVLINPRYAALCTPIVAHFSDDKFKQAYWRLQSDHEDTQK